MTRSLVSLDLETTGLDPRIHVPYEVGMIHRDLSEGGEVERVFWLDLTPEEIAAADPTALAVGDYHQRLGEVNPVSRVPVTGRAEFAAHLVSLLDDNAIIGCGPAFDTSMLSAWIAHNGDPSLPVRPWHHQLLDVLAFAAGALGEPWPLRKGLSLDSSLKLSPLDGAKHTVLGDCRWNFAVYDASLALNADRAHGAMHAA